MPNDVFRFFEEGEICIVMPVIEMYSLDWELIAGETQYLLDHLPNCNRPRVIFDLSQIDYFGSMFLGLLLRCWRQVDDAGGALAICGARPHATELLEMSALAQLWYTYPNRWTAVQEMSKLW